MSKKRIMWMGLGSIPIIAFFLVVLFIDFDTVSRTYDSYADTVSIPEAQLWMPKALISPHAQDINIVYNYDTNKVYGVYSIEKIATTDNYSIDTLGISVDIAEATEAVKQEWWQRYSKMGRRLKKPKDFPKKKHLLSDEVVVLKYQEDKYFAFDKLRGRVYYYNF